LTSGADHVAQAAAQREIAHDLDPIARREPQRHVIDDARIEAGLGGAEQETQDVERGRGTGPGERDRHQPPSQHDPRDPAPGTKLVERDVAGHFEDQVPNEEQRRAQAIGRFGHAQTAQHLQLGEADVLPVDIGDEIEHDQQGNSRQAAFLIARSSRSVHRFFPRVFWFGSCRGD